MEGRLERQLRLVERALVQGRLHFSEAEATLAPISSATVARLLAELCATGMLLKLPDGGYVAGGRPAGWAARTSDSVGASERSVVDALGREQRCTVTWWAIHGRSLRCRYRWLDEHSPALSAPGSVRPIALPIIGGGLLMTAAELEDLPALRAQSARTPLRPGDAALRRLVLGCRREGIYDDRACFWPGSRRIAVRADSGLLAVALAAGRLRLGAERDRLIAALRAAATTLSQLA